jgi:hypothetical protein
VEKTNYWVTLITNFAVLAGILFLAFEIQQSNRIAITNTEIALRSGYSTLNSVLIENPDFAQIFVNAGSEDNNLSAADQLRLRSWLVQLVNQWVAIETAHGNGMAPESTYEVIFDDQRSIIDGMPGIRPILRNILIDYKALSATHTFRSADKILREHSS